MSAPTPAAKLPPLRDFRASYSSLCLDSEDATYMVTLGGLPSDLCSRLSTRVPILFLVPIAAGMVGACKIQGHRGMRTVLPHAAALVRTSAHEPCEHKVYRGLGGRPQERLPVPLNGRRGPTRPSCLWLGRAAFDAVMPCRLWLLGWRDADASLCAEGCSLPCDGVCVAD